jgi:hypothetical protein
MSRQAQAALTRQKIRTLAQLLESQAHRMLGAGPIVRGSFYQYRRRCGKAGCRCERGALHGGRAFAVRAGGRSRTLPLAGVDLEELTRCVGAYRDLRRVRAEMVRAFRELLRQAEKLEGLRQISLAELKRRVGSPSL